MATYADLNSLHNPATGTAPPATWGDQVRDNDTYLYERGPYICTSATRPGSPFHGQIIYETDTFRTLQYYSAAAVWRQPWNMPWGVQGSPVEITSNTTGVTAVADITGLSTGSITYVGNRFVVIHLYIARLIQQTSTGNITVTITNSSNTIQQSWFESSVAGSIAVKMSTRPITPSAGAATYKGRMTTSAGTVDTDLSSGQSAWIYVEDVGPNGNPA